MSDILNVVLIDSLICKMLFWVLHSPLHSPVHSQMSIEYCLLNIENLMLSWLIVWSAKTCFGFCTHLSDSLIVWSAFCIYLFLNRVSKAAVVPGNIISLLFGLTRTWYKSRILFKLIEGDLWMMRVCTCWYSFVLPEGSPIWLFFGKWKPVALHMIVNFMLIGAQINFNSHVLLLNSKITGTRTFRCLEVQHKLLPRSNLFNLKQLPTTLVYSQLSNKTKDDPTFTQNVDVRETFPFFLFHQQDEICAKR